MVLLAVVCYGVAVNMATPLTQRYGSLPVMARMLALASIWTAPFGLWWAEPVVVRLDLVRWPCPRWGRSARASRSC